MTRRAQIERRTAETQITLSISVDEGAGSDIETSVPFMSHMLDQVARHGYLQLSVRAEGDTDIDDHHVTEDLGICLGAGLRSALGDRRGIARFAHAQVPLDDALVEIAIDLSGRPHLAFDLQLPKGRVGTFDVELVREFYQGFCNKAEANLHVRRLAGDNLHHIIEASFKAFGRAIWLATRHIDPAGALPSTKGHLD